MSDNNKDISSRRVLQQAERLKMTALKIEKERDALSECGNIISGSWKGENAAVYLSKAEVFSFELKEVSDRLNDTAEELARVAAEMTANEL